ncbi:hypothetical protein CC2G_013349 [Coprinopsis cinerea AmutBmut pab1-1]|nr:hypothetical protein CC2G_013349 [Coprinopsis cinerea AmutBmut pab1-1]
MSLSHASSGSNEELIQTIGYTFKPSQQSYLREKLDGYVATSGKKRGQYVNQVATHLRKEIQEASGKQMSVEEGRLLKEGVRAWFRERCGETNAKKKKAIWASRWNMRLVFMRLNAVKIKALAQKMAVEGEDVDVDEFLEEWECGDNDVVDDGKAGRNPSRKGRKGNGEEGWFFDYYQTAATALISRLSDKERAQYAEIAVRWKEQGPPPNEQSKLADKAATKTAYSFAEHLHKGFNGVCVMLMGWQAEDGTPTAVKIDFNREFGRSTGFIELHEKKFKSLFQEFKGYVWRLYKEEDDDDDEEENVRIRNQKKDLIPMKTNAYGEPFLPSPTSRKPGETRGDWYSDRLRSFFIYHYAVSSGMKPGSFRFPWGRILQHPRLFIKEKWLPDTYVDKLKELSVMSVADKVDLYDYLYSRQAEATRDESQEDVQTFEISAYLDPLKDVKPRKPRQKKGENDDGTSELEMERFIAQLEAENGVSAASGKNGVDGRRKGKGGSKPKRAEKGAEKGEEKGDQSSGQKGKKKAGIKERGGVSRPGKRNDKVVVEGEAAVLEEEEGGFDYTDWDADFDTHENPEEFPEVKRERSQALQNPYLLRFANWNQEPGHKDEEDYSGQDDGGGEEDEGDDDGCTGEESDDQDEADEDEGDEEEQEYEQEGDDEEEDEGEDEEQYEREGYDDEEEHNYAEGGVGEGGPGNDHIEKGDDEEGGDYEKQNAVKRGRRQRVKGSFGDPDKGNENPSDSEVEGHDAKAPPKRQARSRSRQLHSSSDNERSTRTRKRQQTQSRSRQADPASDDEAPSSFKGIRTRRQRREGSVPKSISQIRSTSSRRKNPATTAVKRRAEEMEIGRTPKRGRREASAQPQERRTSPRKVAARMVPATPTKNSSSRSRSRAPESTAQSRKALTTKTRKAGGRTK